MTSSERWRVVGEAGWAWALSHVRYDDEGYPSIPMTVDDDGQGEPDDLWPDGLHSGIAGLAPALAEVRLTRDWNDAERRLADGIVAALSTHAAEREEASYFGGLAGDAIALRLLEPGAEDVAIRRMLDVVTPDGWLSIEFKGDARRVTDLVMGNAGVALTALWADHACTDEIVTAASEALMRAAVEDGSGLRWYMNAEYTKEMPNYSHGTAGVSAALASAGARLGRKDWVEAASRGAEHVISVSETSNGLRTPCTVPFDKPGWDEFTFTWCHGPAGTSYLFLALDAAGVMEVSGRPTMEWHAECLHAIATSGVPERLYPGFWDNDGRCCGTAGVGEVYLDDAQRQGSAGDAVESLRLAGVMADAIVGRAITDATGTRWRFIEHRAEEPLLPPGIGWMQGAAGIATFLLRTARVHRDGLDAPRVSRPDAQWIRA
jgi:lantibiotic modifying enzyme